MRFAHLVFGTKAKPVIAGLKALVRFAHLVFGTKAKPASTRLAHVAGFAHLVFGTKAKLCVAEFLVGGGFAHLVFGTKAKPMAMGGNHSKGLLTSFLEPRQSCSDLRYPWSVWECLSRYTRLTVSRNHLNGW